eukprot:CAMPEP_0167788578 /NCGR_PEP_ID=MMETSP0111_2-20121227/10126_1 /TAXON_ID=91324 /ORGANISM="Lotharella globosa, Strain CCCM811" /LENGTH=237 /DNA_ID=CAMNT_0007680487 /DNA_START=156 /DNA_END=869 /DNA_ORIENTATION=+
MRLIVALVCLAAFRDSFAARAFRSRSPRATLDLRNSGKREQTTHLNQTVHLSKSKASEEESCPLGNKYCGYPGPSLTTKEITCYDIPDNFSYRNRISFSILPLRDNSHCLVMVADSEQTVKTHDDFFATIRLKDGKFDVRTGNRYTFDEKLEYKRGQPYQVKVIMFHDAGGFEGGYSVQVSPLVGDSKHIASAYGFRNSDSLRSNSGKICVRSPDAWADCALGGLYVYESAPSLASE